MQFITKNTSHSRLHISYKEKYIEGKLNTKFLSLQIDNHLNWKNQIEQMIPKLSAACYAVRSVVHMSNITTQISLLCTLSFYYKIRSNFWGNFQQWEDTTLQKKIVRIMAAAQPRTSCRSLFNQLEILPVPCQCILSLMCFVINQISQTCSFIHNINTRKKHHLHRPNANLSCFLWWHNSFQHFTTLSNIPQE